MTAQRFIEQWLILGAMTTGAPPRDTDNTSRLDVGTPSASVCSCYYLVVMCYHVGRPLIYKRSMIQLGQTPTLHVFYNTTTPFSKRNPICTQQWTQSR